MPTRAQVRQLVDSGRTYEQAARALGIHPGLAYMIATGLPADGGDIENPTRKQDVLEWMKGRAAADAQMRQAAARTGSSAEAKAAKTENKEARPAPAAGGGPHATRHSARHAATTGTAQSQDPEEPL
jgi:hypothetical protein